MNRSTTPSLNHNSAEDDKKGQKSNHTYLKINILQSIISMDSLTVGGSLEERKRELLEDDTNIKINEAGAGDVDSNPLHGKPQEQLLSGNTGELADLAVGKKAGNVAIIVQLALELGNAGLIEMDLESTIVKEGEVRDALGEEAHGEAMGAEDIVDGERSRS